MRLSVTLLLYYVQVSTGGNVFNPFSFLKWRRKLRPGGGPSRAREGKQPENRQRYWNRTCAVMNQWGPHSTPPPNTTNDAIHPHVQRKDPAYLATKHTTTPPFSQLSARARTVARSPCPAPVASKRKDGGCEWVCRRAVMRGRLPRLKHPTTNQSADGWITTEVSTDGRARTLLNGTTSWWSFMLKHWLINALI